MLGALLALAKTWSYLYHVFSNTSDLPLERYHYLSDITMDRMIEQLEDLLDDFGDDSFEVEYHVRAVSPRKYML